LRFLARLNKRGTGQHEEIIMRRVFLLLSAFAMLVLPMGAAEAAWQFGAQEDIHCLQDVTLKGAKDEALCLGYMTKTQYFLAGLYVVDEGYVLGVKGETGRYYHMPTGEDLDRFQRAGTLPNPLPPYKLSFWDYLIGYSLWWALALVALFYIVPAIRKRRAPAAQPAVAPVAPVAPPAPGAPPPPATPPAA
jgi:hypothetical protein